MYSLVVLTFEADYSDFSYMVEKRLKSKRGGGATALGTTSMLFNMHTKLLMRFKELQYSEFDKENYDQFAVYFAFMEVIPRGNDLITAIVGHVPRTSGPCATVPSKLHERAMASTMNNLNPEFFSIQHEFNGLGGIFPVDSAIYFRDELLAFIEVDGEFHYKLAGQQLRRKDQLKEFLYRCRFPDTPLYRIRSDQCRELGFYKLGKGLALWLTALAKKSLENKRASRLSK
jgi:hypothetical protein